MANQNTYLHKFLDFIGQSIQRFVIFLFLLFFLGSIFGAIAINIEPMLLLVPAVFALITYYSRVFAVISFLGLIVLFFI
jgi:hypothetical protein